MEDRSPPGTLLLCRSHPDCERLCFLRGTWDGRRGQRRRSPGVPGSHYQISGVEIQFFYFKSFQVRSGPALSNLSWPTDRFNVRQYFHGPMRIKIIHSFICPFRRSSVYFFLYVFIHPIIHPFINLFIHLIIHAFIYSFIQSSIRSFVHLFIHSLTV